ncbi:MAG: DHH family phosphoesterase [Lachnospiraceae bacterium]|nr:DHH family phosphoesterase [Lachnospiraceae bacterium]
MSWPLFLTIPLIICNVAVYVMDRNAGYVVSAGIAVYLIIALILFFGNKHSVVNDMVSFATQYGQVQKQLLRDLEIPYALLDEDGRIIWTNEAFEQTFHIKRGYRKTIMSLIPDVHKESLPGIESETETMIAYEESDFRISMKKVDMQMALESSDLLDAVNLDSYLIAFFMFDETKINRLQRDIDDQQLSTGLIYIDNYDEALESVEDVRRSLLIALVDRKINKYFSASDALVKKLEKDKYLVTIQKRHLKDLMEKRFDLLEDVKTINIGNEISVTLSIGFGIETGSYQTNYEYARTAIDLALGRGGDQAVIKTPDDITYYGGKSQMAEKSTRVKARVKAHALREIIESNDRIIVMGHKNTDVDSFGAAIGIYRAAKTFEKKAHIVVNEVTNSIRPLMDEIVHEGEYTEDLFLNSQRALEVADAQTALIVVDVNKPSFTECNELLGRCTSIVVLDHHRQGTEKIQNATLSYIEPYASSASEMVAEILQYIHDNVKLRSAEADCIYSGIMIDTNNFTAKTGVRTFEAAAYLRRNGADVTRVRKMFRNNMDDYKARAEAVRNAEVVLGAYAVSVSAPSGNASEAPTVIGAQAANELLNINGIKASFVLTDYQGEIYISARSIDELNVQLVMEKLGGGGHMNIAGCQLKDMTIDEAKNLLIATMTEMQSEGEI